VVETHKKVLKENKQMIRVVWDENLELNIDKNLYKQIVHNLIWNFMKYAWKRTMLTITINKKYIDFSDNWAWIKQTEIPYITEKFYQWNIEKSWNIEHRWIGIWLSIITKIIQAHNWKIEIKSDIWKWFSFKIKM
jgi:signal transduction histidine kinase